jgi:sarcosine oxidase
MTVMKSYQTIIIGLGAMGSAAAYQLSKLGVRVLGIDRFSPPHILGSTHGDTRITRLANGEGSAYAPLAIRSHEIWRELERRIGENLLTITGGLIISNPAFGSPVHGKVDFLQQTVDAAKLHGIAHELLVGPQIREKFPQFNAADNDEAYYEEQSGFVRPERCVGAQLSLAKEQRAQINTNEKVLSFETEGAGVRVVTDAGEYFADNLIVSAGPWIADFIGDQYKSLFRIYRQVLYWFDVDHIEPFLPETFPIFIWDLGDGEDIYGFPAIDGPSGGLKVAPEVYESTTTADTVDRSISVEETTDMYERRIKGRILGVNNKCVKAATCLYTVTPDSNFVIDFLPGSPQIIIASPCSGHGFKHSAAVGEVLAELATDGKSTLDISSFSLNRFALSTR